jgi:hypothetical protein
MPYDRFLTEQLAADLLNDGDPLQRIAALGLFALGPVYYRDAGEAGKAEAAEIDDRIDTLCRGVLGLTVACARCHDHKFDPITTQDYYALAGVFRSTKYVEAPLAPPAEAAKYAEAETKVKAQEAAVTVPRQRDAASVGSGGRATAKYVVAAWKLNDAQDHAEHRRGREAGGGAKASLAMVVSLRAGRSGSANARWLAQGPVRAGREEGLSADEAALATVKTAADAFQKEVLAAVKKNRRATHCCGSHHAQGASDRPAQTRRTSTTTRKRSWPNCVASWSR